MKKSLPINNGRQFISQKDFSRVKQALKSRYLSNGPINKLFENKIANLIQSKYAISCNSGTSALFLALKSINVCKKDIVILPSINFVASTNMVSMLGAKFFLADVDPSTGQISVNSVRECIKKNKIKKVKAIINMYLGGSPREIKSFYNLKKKLKCFLIEDACHAFGSSYIINDKKFRVGSCKHSDICTFSFHPLKSITTGEGGAITLNSKKLYERILLLRSHGIIKSKRHWKYDVLEPGYNLRLSEINAALGLSQLKQLGKFLDYRKKIFNFYFKELNNFKKIISMIVPENKTFSSNHLVVVKVNFKKLKIDKDKFILELTKKGIIIHYHYIPIYMFKYYNKIKGSYKGSKEYYNNTISLPIYFKMKISDMKKVVKEIKKTVIKNILL
tara:strand:+ start:2541 stop:3707 length:1167 start_codon:yes stop_codon:yes gene_type:complete